jgi:hypothetical protein
MLEQLNPQLTPDSLQPGDRVRQAAPVRGTTAMREHGGGAHTEALLARACARDVFTPVTVNVAWSVKALRRPGPLITAKRLPSRRARHADAKRMWHR